MAKFVHANDYGPNLTGASQGTAAPASSAMWVPSEEILLDAKNGEVSYKRNHQNVAGGAYTSAPWAGTPPQSQYLKKK